MRARLIIAVALVTVAGCGGGGGEAAKPEATSEPYAAQAERICAEANRKEGELNPGGLGWHLGEQYKDEVFLTNFSAVGRDAVKQLRALTPPEDIRSAIEAMLASMDRAVATMDAQLGYLKTGQLDRTGDNAIEYESAYNDLVASAGRAKIAQCQGVTN